MTSKESRSVRRGAVGKVPIEATRWRPTLLHEQFLGGLAGAIPPGYPAGGGNAAALPDAQKFQQVKKALGEAFTTFLESAKWKLWHGHADEALTKLAVLRDNVSDEGHRSKLTGLYDYLHRNQPYLVNYDARDQANKTYTSQVAESHIDTLINARHKRTKKMQWTRDGAHHVLQIRALMASDEWESKGQSAVLLALRAVA